MEDKLKKAGLGTSLLAASKLALATCMIFAAYVDPHTYSLEFRRKKDLSILEKGKGGFLVIRKRRINSVEVKYYTAENNDTAPVIIRARFRRGLRELNFKTLKIQIRDNFVRRTRCSIVERNGINTNAMYKLLVGVNIY